MSMPEKSASVRPRGPWRRGAIAVLAAAGALTGGLALAPQALAVDGPPEPAGTVPGMHVSSVGFTVVNRTGYDAEVAARSSKFGWVLGNPRGTVLEGIGKDGRTHVHHWELDSGFGHGIPLVNSGTIRYVLLDGGDEVGSVLIKVNANPPGTGTPGGANCRPETGPFTCTRDGDEISINKR